MLIELLKTEGVYKLSKVGQSAIHGGSDLEPCRSRTKSLFRDICDSHGIPPDGAK